LFNWDGRIGSFSDSELVKDPIGATLQIQQKIKMDEEEQRLIHAQMARFRAGPNPQGRPQVRRPPHQPQCKFYAYDSILTTQIKMFPNKQKLKVLS